MRARSLRLVPLRGDTILGLPWGIFPPRLEAPVRTELCDLFGIDVPIFAFSHCRDVVAAVTNAGGLGVLGALAFAPEQL